jgi:pSer/pThr/pTyr-binding forkhead associated (FHA) protein
MKLICSAGPASGQEFPLSGDEVTIGRAADATISVPDTSVSRKHALLRKTEAGWAVSDLGSGNGTIVSGEPITDERLLVPGDVIALGDSEFQLAEGSRGQALAPAPNRPPGRIPRTGTLTRMSAAGPRARPIRASRNAEDPAVAAKRRRRLFVVAGSTLAVVMALLVGFRAISKKRAEAAAVVAAEREAQRKELTIAFQQAKNLTKEGKWAEAKARIEQIVEFDPTFESKSIATYLDRANTEVPNEKALEDASAALTADQLGTAALALGRVKNTMMEKRQNDLKELLDVKIGESLIDARKRLSSSPRDLAAMEQVKGVAEDVLIARPLDRDAPDIKRQAEDNINRIKNPNLPPPTPETPHLAVMQRFRSGDQSGALSLAQACAAKNASCRALEAQIKEFDAKNKNLENLSSAELKSLNDLDKKISGGGSSDLSKQLRIRLATVFFKEASNAKALRNWITAISKAQTALEVDPGHPGANAIIEEARKLAHDIYLRGYQLRESSPDEAGKLFKDVITMTPPGDTDHEKAKSRLEELQRQ